MEQKKSPERGGTRSGDRLLGMRALQSALPRHAYSAARGSLAVGERRRDHLEMGTRCTLFKRRAAPARTPDINELRLDLTSA